MSGQSYMPFLDLEKIFIQVRDSGAIPEGMAFGWKIPGSADADEDYKGRGQDQDDESERRYHKHDIDRHIEVHYRKKAVHEANIVRENAINDAIRQKLIEKGQDPATINEEKIILVRNQIPPPQGSSEKTLTRTELEATYIVGRTVGKSIINQRKAEQDTRAANRKNVVNQILQTARGRAPASEKARVGNKRHVLLELYSGDPIWSFQDSNGEVIRPRDELDQADTNTWTRHVVRRWVEYDAINTVPELQAIILEMVSEMTTRKGLGSYTYHVMEEVKKRP